MTIERLKEYQHTDSIESIMEGIEADGGVIVHEFISADLLARLNEQLDADIRRTSPGVDLDDPQAVAFWGGDRPSDLRAWRHGLRPSPNSSIMT